MIYGDRIRFRKNEREDMPLFVQWINDPEVRRGISLYLPISVPGQAGPNPATAPVRRIYAIRPLRFPQWRRETWPRA